MANEEPPLLYPEPPRKRRLWPIALALAVIAFIGGYQGGGIFYGLLAALGGALFGLVILPRAKSGPSVPFSQRRWGDSGGNDGSSP